MDNNDNSQVPPVFSSTDTPATDNSAGLYSGPGDQPTATDFSTPIPSSSQADDVAQAQAEAQDLAAQLYAPGPGPAAPASDSQVASMQASEPTVGDASPADFSSSDPVLTQDVNTTEQPAGQPVLDQPQVTDQPQDYQVPVAPAADSIANNTQQQQVAAPAVQGNDVNAVVSAMSSSVNILVTVNSNPTIDELSAAIGLSLALDKSEKKVTAVYSGKTPHAIAFLDPESTFQDNVSSLRDFIISLDKTKADKLKYKVDNETGTVRIFITPYKTTITSKDLDFSAGDYNVDTVIALGVKNREDFDNSILSHGRILHDAQIITINSGEDVSALGTINYDDKQASSISEIITNTIDVLGVGMIDEQVATALMTGIVAATDRFSNVKTTPKVMQVASRLMSAGANQQLISSSVSGRSVQNNSLRNNNEDAKASDAEMVVEHKDKAEQSNIKKDGKQDAESKERATRSDSKVDDAKEPKATDINAAEIKDDSSNLISKARDQVLFAEERTNSNTKQAVGLDGVVDVDQQLPPIDSSVVSGLQDADNLIDASVQGKQSEKANEIKLNDDKSTTSVQTEPLAKISDSPDPVVDMDLPPLPPMPPSFDDPAGALPPIGDFKPDFMDNLSSQSSITEAADTLANKKQSEADQKASMDAKFNAIYGDDPNKLGSA
jgi:hypothetical protein